MPKNKAEKPKREITKRQLSHWQRENRLQRMVMIAGIVVIAAVLIIVGTGLYMNRFKPLSAVVIRVGDSQNPESFIDYKMDYYVDALAYYGRMMGPEYIPYLTDSTTQAIQQYTIIVRAARGLGVTVSDAEVQEKLKEMGLSSNKARMDAVRAELVIQKLRTEHFYKETPETAEHRAILAMFLESEEQVKEVTDRLEAGESFQDLAAELSLEQYSREKNGDLGWLPEGILSIGMGNSLLDEKIFSEDINLNNMNQPVIIEDANLNKQVGYWLLKVTDTDDSTGQVHLFAMLLPSEQRAKEIKAELDEGGDFIELAKAHSLDQEAATNGGDFGLVGKGVMGEAIDNLIFPDDPAQALPVDVVSDPVKDIQEITGGGFWLVQVTGIGNRNVESDNREILATKLVTDWVDKEWSDNEDQIQNLLTPELKEYAIEQAQSR